MKLSQQHQKQIQALMSDLRWGAVEQAVKQYLMEAFVQESIKRDSEFETMWQAAASEGGKYHVQEFMDQLEQEASKGQ